MKSTNANKIWFLQRAIKELEIKKSGIGMTDFNLLKKQQRIQMRIERLKGNYKESNNFILRWYAKRHGVESSQNADIDDSLRAIFFMLKGKL